MDGLILSFSTFFLFIVVLIGVIIGFFNFFFEPIYILIFKKPVFLYWYPFPKKLSINQEYTLENEFPFYKKLSPKKKIYFKHRLKSFLIKYQFIGKENIFVTDEMKILIAGSYVMLTFGLRNYLVQVFDKIIIYPKVYLSTVNQTYHKGEFNAKMKAVVFSWEDFKLGHDIVNDNLHLGLHEFTHALHFHCLRSKDPSAVIFFDEFNNVVQYYKDKVLLAQLIEKKYFRDYAYENQFEFLSVVLEHYFSTPEEFKDKHPALFDSIVTMINHKKTN